MSDAPDEFEALGFHRDTGDEFDMLGLSEADSSADAGRDQQWWEQVHNPHVTRDALANLVGRSERDSE